MAIKSESLGILRSLHAEELLDTWAVFRRLKAIPGEMTYRGMPLMSYFEKLQCDINAIGYLSLRAVVTLVEVPTYQIELAGGYERILDGINRCQIDAAAMLGRCKTLRAKASNLKGPFTVLWTIGATDIIKGTALGDLGVKTLEALASAEYTDVLDESDVELDAMIEALNLTISSLKMFRKLASDKYNIGRDQINAALSELSNQDQGLLDRPSPAHVQGHGQDALSAIFGHRMMSDAHSLVAEEDDLQTDAEVTDSHVPARAPKEEAPAPPQEAVATVVEPPKPKKARKAAKPSVEAPAPVVEDTPMVSPDPVQVILEDPFLGKQQAEQLVQNLEELKQAADDNHREAPEDDVPPSEDVPPCSPEDDFPPDVPTPEDDLPTGLPTPEDDFPSDDVPPAQPSGILLVAEEEEDLSFLSTVPVVNATPASQELAAMALDEDPLAPVIETKKAVPPATKVDPPKAVKEVAAKVEPAPAASPAPGTVRPRNGLFRSKSNIPMAPAFTRPTQAPVSSPADDVAEFM